MADIVESTGLGAALSPEEWAGYVLDHLSAESVLLASGARRVDTEAKQVHVPRLTSDGAASWYSELEEIGPRSAGGDDDIRFLDQNELEALLRAVPDDTLGTMEPVLYLTAAMTGLRQGELVALRWRDVDWTAGLIRVRRSFTRGQFGTPKSRRSSRAVPMADRLAGELERYFQRSNYQADDDLVFCHPETGNPYDASKLRRRFKKAVGRAEVREVRFHDLRHSYGTAIAAAGAPLRSLMEWMGHADLKTTLVYADYSPDQAQGAAYAEAAFGLDDNPAEVPEKTSMRNR